MAAIIGDFIWFLKYVGFICVFVNDNHCCYLFSYFLYSYII
nr:MAG TPA: hypothetical protein [Caudoviricetes sp.]